MYLGFALIRRRLLALLAIALAVVVWPSIEHAKFDQVGTGQSQPWQSDPSSNAILEIASEVETDSAKDFAGNDGKIGLHATGEYALTVGPAQRSIADGLAPWATQLIRFPNKTGPPSV